MLTRAEAESRERELLAPYASKSGETRGRVHEEAEHPYRAAYVRDRDRVIHSSAFRRLEYKTQVFVYHEGDYYRTRLTHTLEVAQVGRIAARALNVNEDLCEAIALSHDIGHPPFGHSGERAINDLMADDGGFEHNVQALRIVDHIERRYEGFRGLNLTWETREAIAKHSKAKDHSDLEQFKSFPNPSLEAQIADAADSIAYVSHDLDDGLKSGLIGVEMLDGVALWRTARERSKADSQAGSDVLNYQVIRNIIEAQVTDLVRRTEENAARFGHNTSNDVRMEKELTADFSPEMTAMREEMRGFLKENMYRHSKVIRMEEKAYRVVVELFQAYERTPKLLPERVYRRIGEIGPRKLICDYIAGMTDRYALEDHSKLFDPLSKV